MQSNGTATLGKRGKAMDTHRHDSSGAAKAQQVKTRYRNGVALNRKEWQSKGKGKAVLRKALSRKGKEK